MNRSVLKRDILLVLECEPVSNVTTLADALGYLRPSVSRALAQLRDNCLVVKHVREWSITPAGIRKVKELEMQAAALFIAAEQMAKFFHETYEELAPLYGYETRKETAIPWDAIPDDSPNKRLMIAVCRRFLEESTANVQYNVNESVDHTTMVFGGSES